MSRQKLDPSFYLDPNIDEYTLEELASLLKVSTYTLRRRIRDGRLKAKKLFKEYRVKKEDVEDFIDREYVGMSLVYFSSKGNLYKKKELDGYRLEEEAIHLVENVKVLANTDAARVYYERGLDKRGRLLDD